MSFPQLPCREVPSEQQIKPDALLVVAGLAV